MEINSKICTKCKEERPFSEYTKARFGRYGLRSECKRCRTAKACIQNSTRKEAISAYGKKYRKEKIEQIATQRAIHTAINKKRLTEYQKRWTLANPGKVNAKTARRRAARRNAMPKWLTKDHHLEIVSFYDEAVKKTRETGISHEVDHEIPLQGKNVCGLHVPWNLKVITKTANRRKSRKF